MAAVGQSLPGPLSTFVLSLSQQGSEVEEDDPLPFEAPSPLPGGAGVGPPLSFRSRRDKESFVCGCASLEKCGLLCGCVETQRYPAGL